MPKITLSILVSIVFFQLAYSQVYQSAESVEYDPVNQQWLIANGNILTDDGNGNLGFFGSASASHGIEVLGNVIYGNNSNIVRAYDLSTTELLGSITISGAIFLNGMTNDGGTNIYVSDFSTKKIHRIDVSDPANMIQEVIVDNTGSTPNGIVYDGENNRLLMVSWGNNAAIRAIDLSDNSITTIVSTNLGNIDGIDEDNEGNYYLSSWSPSAQISKFDKDFANPLEVISTPFINNPADIGYSLELDTLAIPIGNDVVFVGFESPMDSMPVSTRFVEEKEVNFQVYPNPVSNHSFIQFELQQPSAIRLDLLDNKGSLIHTLLNQEHTSGIHKVLFTGHNLSQGVYYCRLEIDNKIVTKPIIVL